MTTNANGEETAVKAKKPAKEKAAKETKNYPISRAFGPYSIGDKVWARHRGQVYTGEIIAADDGARVRLDNVDFGEMGKYHQLVTPTQDKSVEFKGLSLAHGGITGFAGAILPFWKLGEPTEAPARGRAAGAKPKAEKKPRKTKVTAEAVNAEPAEPTAVAPSESSTVPADAAPVEPMATESVAEPVTSAAEAAPAEATVTLPTFTKVEGAENRCPDGFVYWTCDLCAENENGFCLPVGEDATECLHGHMLPEPEPVALEV